MPSLPFQQRLIKPVMTGTKPGTVRQLRQRNPIKVGDQLYIFSGYRTKQCKRHGWHICKAVYPIEINCKRKTISLAGIELVPIIRHWFAATDIQGSETEFFEFFKKMNYKRPLVWIVWDSEVVTMVNQWLLSQRAPRLDFTDLN